jgi:hypothetical protein
MPGPKLNNRRKYPDADRQPRHIAHLRAQDLKERQEAYDKLSLEEKLAKLPPEPLCAKQRAKLLAKIEKRDRKPAPKDLGLKPGELTMVSGSTTPPSSQEKKQEKQARKYMKNQ